MEELRLQSVRAACEELVAAYRARLAEVTDTATQQLAAEALSASSATMVQARELIQAQPDRAHADLTGALQAACNAIAQAESAAHQWQAEQTAAVAAAQAVRAQTAAIVDADDPAAVLVERARNAAHTAVELAASGARVAAEKATKTARALVVEAHQARLDETIRRETVKALLKSLKSMGFVVARPAMQAGVVVLEGRLPSGRRARFEVAVDGELVFELDGYEGHACAKDLQRITTDLRDRYGVRMGPPQFVWTQPERISKGARSLPVGAGRKGGCQ